MKVDLGLKKDTNLILSLLFCKSVQAKTKKNVNLILPEAIGRGGERGSGISVLMAQQDDDVDYLVQIWQLYL